MSYYPIMLDFAGMSCLVAGGGTIALHKASLLCEKDAKVTVIAPKIDPKIRKLPVTIQTRPVASEDVRDCFLVVDATADEEAERLLRDACKTYGAFYDSACRVGDGTATFMAVYETGRTVVAVSTRGASPAASVMLRDRLKTAIPDAMDEILDCMAALRPLSRQSFSLQSDRKRFLYHALNAMLEKRAALTESEIESIRNEIQTVKKEEDER